MSNPFIQKYLLVLEPLIYLVMMQGEEYAMLLVEKGMILEKMIKIVNPQINQRTL